MNKIIFFTMSLLSLCMQVGSAAAAETPEIYELRPGDTVMISVWREDTLIRQVVVLPDGSVTFPLIGRVDAAGLSAPELERNIAAKLKKYLPDPIVTVVVVGIDGSRAYVMGKVARPGPVVINGPITVLQAISLVGGLDRFADEDGIKLIRGKAEGQKVIAVNFKDIMSGKNVSTNVQLRAGDTLVVP